jgi:hypothetical protein
MVRGTKSEAYADAEENSHDGEVILHSHLDSWRKDPAAIALGP